MKELERFILRHRVDLEQKLAEQQTWTPSEVARAVDGLLISRLGQTFSECLECAPEQPELPAEQVYFVTPENNFCRVFRFSPNIPTGFCFGNGVPVNMVMVDWFNPIRDVDQSGSTVPHSYLVNSLVPWLSDKVYVKPGMQYVAIFDFGAAVVFGEPWTGLRNY